MKNEFERQHALSGQHALSVLSVLGQILKCGVSADVQTQIEEKIKELLKVV